MRLLLSCKVKAPKRMSAIYLRFSVICCLSPPYPKTRYVKLHSLLQNGMGNCWFQTANVKNASIQYRCSIEMSAGARLRFMSSPNLDRAFPVGQRLRRGPGQRAGGIGYNYLITQARIS